MEPIKAVGLLSGGLDSTLAARVILDQGIEVYAINFVSPFCTCTPKSMGCSAVANAVKQLGNIPLKRVALGDEYLHMVKSPKYGHGRGLNPCIDCRIMKIRKAADYMREIQASFLFTGEVLGQRPMSQHRRAMQTIDRESAVSGLILRPLSASHFPPTEPERTGIVDRSKLLGFEGRTRKPQIALAKEKNIVDYPCPGGGCLLTDKLFAERLSDYFGHCDAPSVKDIPLLKIGRHFRTRAGKKNIVARDEREGRLLEQLAPPSMHIFIPVNFSGPTILSDDGCAEEIRPLFRRYSKMGREHDNRVSHGFNGAEEIMEV